MWHVFAVFSFIYWTPKFFFVNLLEHAYPQIITRNHNSQNIALTFDDVPYGSFESILNILDVHGAKATFFIISGDVKDRHSLIRAVKSGHQLANHGHTNSMHILKSSIDLDFEIRTCQQLIIDVYKEANVPLPAKQYYRPGCGLFNSNMLQLAKAYELQTALGSVYPNDAAIPFSLINYWYLIGHIEKGDVVVLHDRSWTPKMLPQLLKWLKQQKISSVTLDKLFE